MRKLFGREKIKTPKSASGDIFIASPEEGQYYQQATVTPQDRYAFSQNHAAYPVPPRSSSDDHWDIVSHDAAAVQSPYSPRPPSPFNTNVSIHSVRSNGYRDQQPPPQQQTLRKKPPNGPAPTAAVGILRALDPHPDLQHQPQQQYRERSDDTQTEFSFREDRYKEDKKEKKGFWDRAKEKTEERDRERQRARERERREDDSQAELTRMIGYLTATASEDWSLVLEVCERASVSENGAKETAKALRREFKYAEPPAQLSAARLWAILLRNASQIFVVQCSTRKFLDTLEDVISNSRTSPVVRERLLQVLAAATYYNPPRQKNDKDGFRPLWRKLKDPLQPEEGIPFDAEDSMLNPPIPTVAYASDTSPRVPSPRPPIAPPHVSKQKSQQRIIPPEEDMRRLFQECKVGRGNASLLSEALAFAKPEDLKNKPIIKEFYARCRASQELIYAQIPWASAGAERSRAAAAAAAAQEGGRRLRKNSPTKPPRTLGTTNPDEPSPELTVEEQLLAALLSANEDLTGALRVYEELERLKIERETEERSKKETRMGHRRPPHNDESDSSAHRSGHYPHVSHSGPPSSPSPSPSPSPAPSAHVKAPSIVTSHPHPLPPIPPSTPTVPSQTLAPPPHAPHGPRYPSQNNLSNNSRSRSPSPDKDNVTPPMSAAHHGGEWERERSAPGGRHRGHGSVTSLGASDGRGVDPSTAPRMSEKALGKRRQIEPEDSESAFDPHDLFHDTNNGSPHSDPLEDFDSDESHSRVQYAYDAAAERTKERIRQGMLAAKLVPGVH